MLEELKQRLNLDEPPQVKAEVLVGTELLRITVEDQNPILAKEAADTLAEILIARSKETVTGSGKASHEIIGEQLQQIEDDLNQSREELDSVVAQFPEDSERIAAINRSIELKEQTYNTLLDQYERSRVMEAMHSDSLSVVEQAITPQAPSMPRSMLNIVLGFMVGVVGGTGLALLVETQDTTLHIESTADRAVEASP